MILRPYQEAALTATSTALARGVHRQLWQSATGTGKTVGFSALLSWPAIVEWLSQFPPKERRMLVIAHREELLDQAAEKIRKAHPELLVCVEQGERRTTIHADVVVASIQTLAAVGFRRLERLLRSMVFRIVVVDEAHHSSATTYRTALVKLGFLPTAMASDVENDEAIDLTDVQAMQRALAGWDTIAPKDRLLLGVTATPNRSDTVGLGCVFQEIVYSYPIRRAIDDEWLVPIVPWAIETDTSLDEVRVSRGDLQQNDLAKAVNNAKRNDLAIAGWREHAAGRSTIAFTVDVAHAHAVAEAFRAAGVRAQAISGETPKDDRRAYLRQFQDGQFDVLSNCFDRATEILSRDKGWIGPSEVEVGDVVAGVDRNTGECHWTPVNAVVHRDSAPEERFVAIKNQTLDLRVTEGHRLLWRTAGAEQWQITEASRLPGKRSSYEFRVSTWMGLARVPLEQHELEFLGLFATDGSLNRKRASVEIAQSAASPMCREIERILTACDFDWKMSERTGHTPAGEPRRYRVYRVPKGNIGGKLRRRGWGRLEQWMEKSLSAALADCSVDQFDALVNGLWIGDGLKTHRALRPRSGIEICTADPVLADRVQAWAVVRSWACSVSWRDNGPRATKPIAYLRLRKRLTVQTNNAHVATSGGNPARFETTSPEPVWCVSNDYGTVIARRRGRVMVAGQCMVLTEGTDLPRTSCILHLKPTKSATLYEQMTGRGLRLFPGKDDCIVLDLVDLSRRHSLQTAPSLYGLPPGLMAAGEELDALEDEWTALREEFASFDAVGALGAEHLTLAALRARATKVDLWTVQPLGDFGVGRKLSWLKTDQDVFRLNYALGDTVKESLTVQRDMLGRWEVVLTTRQRPSPTAPWGPYKQQTLGAAIMTADAAASVAEGFVERMRPNVMRWQAVDANWKNDGPSKGQLDYLKKLRVPIPAGLTKGRASELINLAKSRRPR